MTEYSQSVHIANLQDQLRRQSKLVSNYMDLKHEVHVLRAAREVMDIRQASDYLGISPDTLYKYASEGFVPAFKLGNRWRFKRSRLDEWMDKKANETTR